MTDRQREIVALVRDGLTYKQIGARLGISSETAKGHVARIALRRGVTTQPLRWVLVNADKLLAA